jgi:hypothetical protein
MSSARTPRRQSVRGVDEEDVHRTIRRVRLGLRAVVRAATNLGGDAGDKTPPRPEDYQASLYPSLVLCSGVVSKLASGTRRLLLCAE